MSSTADVDADAHRRATYRTTLAFFDELSRCGVRHVCVSPGSRSAPLAVAAATIARERGEAVLRTWIHLDERSGAFFALGMAKALREPVALVCTSGTAAANLLPAIVEARYAGVALIALTADRPPEVRDRGAGQTIEQMGLYGANVRWFHEVAAPGQGGPAPSHARSLAARAVAEALGRPRGAVHLNWPLREPLDPPQSASELPALLHEVDEARRGPQLAASHRQPTAEAVDALTELVRTRERGVIACGPDDVAPELADAVRALAHAAGWPLLAEPTSGARGSEAPCIARSDLLLRDARFAAAHRPDVVLRIGRTPTSKAQRLWLESAPPRDLVLVDPDRSWNDASALATLWIESEPVALCRAVCERLSTSSARSSRWLESFVAADRAADRAIRDVLAADDRLLAARVVGELAAGLPPAGWLYVSNSMAVRDVDQFWPGEDPPRRVLSSRGASGIDGITSSALGAAAATKRPVALLTGDIAFLHDVGGLLAAKRYGLSATIVVLNDDGGAIFSYLPIARHGEAVGFEELFRTPHGVDLAAAAALAGAAHERVADVEAFRSALATSFAARGLHVIEVTVDPEANLAQHRAIEAAVKDALSNLDFSAQAG